MVRTYISTISARGCSMNETMNGMIALSLCALLLFGCGDAGDSKTSPDQEALADEAPDPLPLQQDDGVVLVPATVGTKDVSLALDTSLPLLVLFSDRLDTQDITGAGASTNETITFLSYGEKNSARLVRVDLALGTYAAKALPCAVMSSSSFRSIAGYKLGTAVGILGLRYHHEPSEISSTTPSSSSNPIDSPLAKLSPRPWIYELLLKNTQEDSESALASTLTLGNAKHSSGIDPSYLFHLPITGTIDQENPTDKSFTEVEPSVLLSNNASATTTTTALLSTSIGNYLVLDNRVAATLGYDRKAKAWGTTTHVDLFANSIHAAMPIKEKIPTTAILIRDFSSHSLSYGAVIGREMWQHLAYRFESIDYQSGGPAGLLTLVPQSAIGGKISVNLENIPKQGGVLMGGQLADLPGLNSIADDKFGDVAEDGQTIVFQSDRPGGAGKLDIYVYVRGEKQGLLDLPGLNSSEDDADPSISADGTLIAFHSNRKTHGDDFDIYLYDISRKQFVEIPGLNTKYVERNPDISPDKRFIAFRSERPDGASAGESANSDILLYDLKTHAINELPTLNSDNGEYDPSLSNGAAFISFDAFNRDDSAGADDVYLYAHDDDEMLDLDPDANGPFRTAASSIDPTGDFLAFDSNEARPDLGNQGRDVMIYHKRSGEFIYLPGLNSRFEDSAPAITTRALYIAFHSSRPTSLGGYDIYLYERSDALGDFEPNFKSR